MPSNFEKAYEIGYKLSETRRKRELERQKMQLEQQKSQQDLLIKAGYTAMPIRAQVGQPQFGRFVQPQQGQQGQLGQPQQQGQYRVGGTMFSPPTPIQQERKKYPGASVSRKLPSGTNISYAASKEKTIAQQFLDASRQWKSGQLTEDKLISLFPAKGIDLIKKERGSISRSTALNIMSDPFKSKILKKNYPKIYDELDLIVKQTDNIGKEQETLEYTPEQEIEINSAMSNNPTRTREETIKMMKKRKWL